MTDHRYISFEVRTQVTHRKTILRNARKTDWVKYTCLVSESLGTDTPETIWSVKCLDSMINRVTKCLNKAYEKACPKNRPRKKTQPLWWNKKLSDTRKIVRSLFRRAKNENNQDVWSEYRSSLRVLKKELRTAKRESQIRLDLSSAHKKNKPIDPPHMKI